MMLKIDGFKRVLSVGALALATATSAIGAPKAQARVDVGIGLGAPPVVMAPPAVVAAPPVVAPYGVVAPPIVGPVNLGFGVGHDDWHGDRGWHERGHERR